MKMQWRKAPVHLMELFDGSLPDDARVERRKMFGYPAGFVNGNMFAGVHQENIVLRLDEAERVAAQREHAARTFEPMPGRPMRDWIVAPARFEADAALLREWVGRAFAFAASLAPKGKKAGGKTKASAKGRAASAKRKTTSRAKRPSKPKKR